MARRPAQEANGRAVAPLLIVGGYGLVGEQAARLLRQRNPGLPLLIGGRHPERGQTLADAIGAQSVAVDVTHEQPLADLPERPAAVLAAVSDPHDYLLADAMRRGIPIADINRAGPASLLDAFIASAREHPTAPVLLSGSWMAGVSALAAAAAVREAGEAQRVSITALVSSDDKVGPDSWGFSDRMAWPYYPMREGRRQTAHPLTGVQRERCADRVDRPAALVGTLEQSTLPVTLGVPTVETRMALQSNAALYALIALKRSGALRGLTRPSLRGIRSALLQRQGTGDFAGLTVTARGPAGSVSVDLLDPRGQAHLSAVGAACAAERVLAPGLAAGISFPEQSADPLADLEMLRQAGVVVRLAGFTTAASTRDDSSVKATREVIGQP